MASASILTRGMGNILWVCRREGKERKGGNEKRAMKMS